MTALVLHKKHAFIARRAPYIKIIKAVFINIANSNARPILA
jgi:hypothetical protein